MAVHPDVSEYQAIANNSFNRRFLMFRADSEYDRPDAKAPANLAWAVPARRAGRLDNFGVYVIPGFVSNAALIARLDYLGVPRDCVVMIDWERWGGRLVGDLSALDNDLANRLRARQGGRADLVWGYSNRGDLAGWAHRPAWLGFIIAGYNSNDPRDEGIGNVIGWQYTNGVENHTANPSSTPPFGACDHNVMFINYPKLQGASPVTPAEIAAIARASAEATVTAFKLGGVVADLNTQTAQLEAFEAAKFAALLTAIAGIKAGQVDEAVLTADLLAGGLDQKLAVALASHLTVTVGAK